MRSVKLFFETLTPDVLAPSDYVDWERINQKVRPLRREIALLQALDKDDAVSDLGDLLNKHPRILLVLQLLIAHTPDKLYFDAIGEYVDFVSDMPIATKQRSRARAIAEIFVEMGIVRFLNEVKSVEDVIKGVLIGLEPNARKTRRGKKMEDRVKTIVERVLDELNRDHQLELQVESHMHVSLSKGQKQVDYAVLKGGHQVACIETNFYSTSGSKPSEVLERAYPEVQAALKDKGLALIVITDGYGWTKMKPVIQTAYSKLDYLMNLRMAEKGCLAQAFKNILGLR